MRGLLVLGATFLLIALAHVAEPTPVKSEEPPIDSTRINQLGTNYYVERYQPYFHNWIPECAGDYAHYKKLDDAHAKVREIEAERVRGIAK